MEDSGGVLNLYTTLYIIIERDEEDVREKRCKKDVQEKSEMVWRRKI